MKQCSRCKEIKLVSEFCKSSRAKDGYQPACKSCMAVSWRASRSKKLEHYKDVQKLRNEKNKQVIDEWKRQQGCQRCSENDPSCLDLHHLDPSIKEDHPSLFVNISVAAFMKEAAKCVVLCANCHRKLHAGRFNLGIV